MQSFECKNERLKESKLKRWLSVLFINTCFVLRWLTAGRVSQRVFGGQTDVLSTWWDSTQLCRWVLQEQELWTVWVEEPRCPRCSTGGTSRRQPGRWTSCQQADRWRHCPPSVEGQWTDFWPEESPVQNWRLHSADARPLLALTDNLSRVLDLTTNTESLLTCGQVQFYSCPKGNLVCRKHHTHKIKKNIHQEYHIHSINTTPLK